ncbi:hypothetical protein [Actinopolymorpha rutila]|uniref:Putative phage baseplate assembly protein n=1 Tax=Actinopolymorpha rutila TaxID=446787 RepID=A0A852ZEW4_9ACTN|nr:hypothetical protein [Actinopolymorpha rutila]NYH90823.1 putative phage baseplate assembly protein [Actinopolymorpha rutila]
MSGTTDGATAADCGCGCGGGCGTTAAGAGAAGIANPAGLGALAWRVSPHDLAMQRMRADLAAGAPDRPAALRTLARHPTDDPAIAVLDAFATVADIVSFYTERIAQEGFLRTAAERLSVRELAATVGYQLRPGVAAQVELAFEAETAPGAPAEVLVAAGTPMQSIPGQGQLPQTFETEADLVVRGVWNRLPVRAAEPQAYDRRTRSIWLTGTATPVRTGDHVLVVGKERITDPEGHSEVWDFRTVTAVTLAPDGLSGWIRLDLNRALGNTDARPLIAEDGPSVHLLTDRTRLFGHNAPDPSMLVTDQGPPPGSEPAPQPSAHGSGPTPPRYVWSGFALGEQRDLELDGDHPSVLAGTWIVLEQPEAVEALLVRSVEADGLAKWGLTGPITRTLVDLGEDVGRFNRRRAKVHCGSVPLPAAQAPLRSGLGGDQVDVPLTEPLLAVGRLVLVAGPDATTGQARSELRAVKACEALGTTGWMRLTLDAVLTYTYERSTATVRANVATATHGETVRQVLGSGSATPFTEFGPRRTPLTYVRAATPDGAVAELEVRVDGVAWHEVADLGQAGPAQRAYVLRHTEDGQARITFGDGVHGSRVPTGVENVEATYRVGIGADGAVDAGQVSLLARRPLGIREVANPGPAHDWAPPEDLETARVNAPLRIRTLDRAVSVADHADFVRGFAGVGPARADLVWDGRQGVVLVSLLGVAGVDPSQALLDDVGRSLLAARDAGQHVLVRACDVVEFGLGVDLAHDPDHRRDDVLAAVRDALKVALGRAGQAIGAPVSSAQALAVIRSVAGVRACTLPDLQAAPDVSARRGFVRPRRRRAPSRHARGTARTGATRAANAAVADRLLAAPGRFEPGTGFLPAQLLALDPARVTIGVMSL